MNVVELIGLGLAVDYSLLVVTRYREELARAESREEAVVRTMATAGRAVVFSGVAVAIGLALLLFMPVPFIRTLGLAGLLIPLVSIVGRTDAAAGPPVVLRAASGRVARACSSAGAVGGARALGDAAPLARAARDDGGSRRGGRAAPFPRADAGIARGTAARSRSDPRSRGARPRLRSGRRHADRDRRGRRQGRRGADACRPRGRRAARHPAVARSGGLRRRARQ